MGKALLAGLLILGVCTIYSYSQDNKCRRFCNWAQSTDVCQVRNSRVCRRMSYEFVRNRCGCCSATCIHMVGEGESCRNNPREYFKQCVEGTRCVSNICVGL